MGAVYRATDTKLNRDVAIKVLPQSFAADRDRMLRFQREAEVLASLNHPNIAAIYGVEENALVMELVEGQTLAGGLPIPAVIDYARQIAEAIEYAHDRGVVHRDLKPANIKVTPEGVVKLLDFGLAKAAEDVPAAERPADSPTLTIGASRSGVIIGTAAYMSPEQAVGKPADRRSDIFSYGVVLYEMLTGKPAFEGETIGEILAAVVKDEPDWSKLPSDTPAAIRALLSRCLTKDRRRRLQAIGEARIALENPNVQEAEPQRPTRPGAAWRWAPWAIVAAVGIVAVWGWMRPDAPETRPIVRFTEMQPGAADELPTSLTIFGGRIAAISPDGSRIAYISSNPDQIRLRSLTEPDAQTIELPKTGRRLVMAFSPDGQWIGYIGQHETGTRTLYKVAIKGGMPIPLTEDVLTSVPFLRWAANDTILFQSRAGLASIPSTGGNPRVLAPVEEKGPYTSADLLPDGKTLLYTLSAVQQGEIGVRDIQTGKMMPLVPNGGPSWYAATGKSRGHLVYFRQGTLYAAPFDPGERRLLGDAIPVLQRVASGGTMMFLGISNNGTLIYSEGEMQGRGATSTLVWVDRQGKEEPIAAPPRSYENPRLSPDGGQVLLTVADQGSQGSETKLWTLDLQRRVLTLVTSAAGSNPVWAPDGKRIYFTYSNRQTGADELVSLTTGSNGIPERKGNLTISLDAVSPDEKWGIEVRGPRRRPLGEGRGLGRGQRPVSRLYLWPLAGDVAGGSEGRPLLNQDVNNTEPAFSLDGKWLAYTSNESGRNEVYVNPLPGPGPRLQISNEGGTFPRWSHSGRELYYFDRGRVHAVELQPAGSGLRVASSKFLFANRDYHLGYDVARDGRFLMLKTANSSDPYRSLRVIVNWFEELRRNTSVP